GAAAAGAPAGGGVFVRDLVGGGSYLSASDRTLYLGLGGAPRIDRLDVTWPWGKTETWRDLPGSGAVRVTEGTGPRTVRASRLSHSVPVRSVSTQGNPTHEPVAESTP